jgi:hypothetical protein
MSTWGRQDRCKWQAAWKGSMQIVGHPSKELLPYEKIHYIEGRFYCFRESFSESSSVQFVCVAPTESVSKALVRYKYALV